MSSREGKSSADPALRIWVDADATPRDVRRVLLKAARRLDLPLIFVANHDLGIETSQRVEMRFVRPGADVADRVIAAEAEAGDLVITADVPLAAVLVEQGITAIDPRGDEYHEDDIRTRLSERNFMDTMRSAGLVQGGPAEYGNDDLQRFAATLDRWLTRRLRSPRG